MTTYGLLFFNTNTPTARSITVNLAELGASSDNLGYGLNEVFDPDYDIDHLEASQNHTFTVKAQSVLLYMAFPSKWCHLYIDYHLSILSQADVIWMPELSVPNKK